ncbi:MAG: hypothetical protein EBR82_11680 [Caulobacteraceae bacterium]|nr:hypothetical protein [Caulobacteraceae bacterium]
MKRIITPKVAKEAGYRAMTNPYVLPKEADMLQSVVLDMTRAKADYALVAVSEDSVEVWRK